MPAAIPWETEIYPLLFAVAGALVAAALPRRPVGWLMLFVGGCFAANAAALQWLATGHTAGAAWLAWWVERGSAVLVPATLALVLLLPDGRLPHARWRPLLGAMVVGQLTVIAVGCLVAGPIELGAPLPNGATHVDNPLSVLPARWDRAVELVVGPVLVAPFALGAVAVVQRLRRPAGDERPRVVLVLVGLLVFTACLTLPDLVWPAGRTGLHVVGVLALTGSLVIAVGRGQLAPVRIDQLAAATSDGEAAVGSRPAPSTSLTGSASVLARLSPREREVLEHVARGLTNREIAEALVVSPITVRNQVSSILTKLDVANRTQAVSVFLGSTDERRA